MKFLNCCLHIVSFITDLSPIGTFKSAVELITGRDFISQENLSGKERLLYLVGLIPVVGKAAKKKQQQKIYKIIKRYFSW